MNRDGVAITTMVGMPSENMRLEGEKDDEATSVEWAQEDSVSFEGILTKYLPNENVVMKGVSLRVEKGSRMGMVGLTGSGQLMLLLTLLNMTIVEKDVVRVGVKQETRHGCCRRAETAVVDCTGPSADILNRALQEDVERTEEGRKTARLKEPSSPSLIHIYTI
ncbi:hypothetical protein BLNAU_2170 [Blattamonas nauphoetae]|uniref:ABC transporter domain-containing protein n=1 Tax=Blattamonas nauphoetae TaxID=2049346 RepID=A0ABQ9YG62_9EUKA|nr:hypothetical protein BLNAU_2170 [Blattamonas nauphoetae]